MAAQNHTVNSRRFTRFLFFFGITLIFSITAGSAYSANLTLAWDANNEPDLIGYRVYCGDSSGNYTVTHEITSSNPNNPPPTTCEFTGLEEGKKYYFAAIAYSDNGQSDYSQEISYTVPAPPVISDIDNDGYTVAQGDCNDADSSINPGAIDLCGDGIDQDCNGSDLACLPVNTDSDGDGLTDSEEQYYNTDPNNADTDGDGLIDFEEVKTHNTDPNNADTDGDGFSDAEEVANGFNPRDIDSKPAYGLVQEAEKVVLPIGSAFKKGSDPAASNGEYVYVPNGIGSRMDGPDETHKVVYTFNLLKAGTYQIKGTIYAANGSDDSFWIKVNGNPADGYLWDVLQNTGYQQDYVNDRNGADPVEVSLEEGLNTVTVYLREDGTRLDRIELELVATVAPVIDEDGDGYTAGQGDCNDTKSDINPDATDICGDGIDQDCDGLDEICPEDIDHDGYTVAQGDCNDANSSINPGAIDLCGDGIDQDCNGSDLACVDVNTDSDGDGLTDFEELNTYFTDPNSADTDGDGFSDGEEIAGGFDPTDQDSMPTLNPAWNSASDYSAVFALGTGHTGIVEANFDVTPLADRMNGGVGYADSSVGINSYRDMAMFVRMNRYGRFDVRNGRSYVADVDVSYTANSTYHVRMLTDLNAGTYDVWVTPPGGTITQIAKNYIFRSDAPPTDDLGKVCLIDYSGEFRVENHTLAQEAEDGDSNGAFEIEEVITEIRVAASSDDAEESAAGRVSNSSSDLELTYDRSYQTVGMRFSGTAIPNGATIVNAFIQFQTDETQSVATSLTIQGEDTDNAGAFLSQTRNISSRPRTTAAVSWSPPAWTTVGEAGPDQRTPDIASVIQEIVNRPGWSSDHAMVLIITGTGERVAESYDGAPAAAPLLHVEFIPGD